ncbi:kinase-like domain-containing protein [Tanacetum coccineum]|uniref:Kinase-like domain-containing protein n=1 Tax=Tanacetum coccineum TaxID=301880 RepID=A0ABQ4XI64_9ASTR
MSMLTKTIQKFYLVEPSFNFCDGVFICGKRPQTITVTVLCMACKALKVRYCSTVGKPRSAVPLFWKQQLSRKHSHETCVFLVRHFTLMITNSVSIPTIVCSRWNLTFFGNINKWHRFIADRNRLVGNIPDFLGHWKSVKPFVVGGRVQFSGSIPSFPFQSSTPLVNISLIENQLTGSLPSQIGNQLPNLAILHLRNNKLTGVLPHSLSNCSKLRFLEMNHNNFSGKVAVDFSKTKRYFIDPIGYNNSMLRTKADRHQEFIVLLQNCTNIDIVLFRCNLIGVLPTSIGNLSDQLSFLSLGGNQLFGSIPSSIEYGLGSKMSSNGDVYRFWNIIYRCDREKAVEMTFGRNARKVEELFGCKSEDRVMLVDFTTTTDEE